MDIKHLEKEVITSTGSLVELLNNIIYIAAAYNQIWTLKPVEVDDKTYIALIDERTEQIKVLFLNPDSLMERMIEELKETEWFDLKMQVLNNPHLFESSRVTLTEKNL